jgi:hypothetical protein
MEISSSVLALIGIIMGSILAWKTISISKVSSERVTQAESRVDAQPEKAKPAWDLARVTLEAYFNRNLAQIAWIFWLSVVTMMIGFATIIWGVSRALQFPSALEPAKIASLAGIITEFIGATFLFIYRSTIRQANYYSKTLERINSVGMAMQILDTIPDKYTPDDLKSKTKASLVELFVRQAYEIREKSDEYNEEKTRDKKASRP